MLRSILTLLLVLLAMSPSAAIARTSVALRTSATLSADAQQVRLSDVAEISGAEAAAVGVVVVVSEAELSARSRPNEPGGVRGALRVDMAMVRAALEVMPGMNAGRLMLRGGSCNVMIGDAPVSKANAPAAPRADRIRPSPVAVDMSGPPTIRTEIASRVAVANGVNADRIKLGFDAADDAVLDTPIGDRTVDVDLAAAAGSARLPVRVTLYSGERIDLTTTVQADVLVRRMVVRAAMALEKGKAIGADDLVSEDAWGPPGSSEPVGVDQLIGQLTSRRIPAGEAIGLSDVAPAIACKRGDTVYVHCVSGSVVVKVKARAMGSARDGEIVQLKMEGSEESFTARMSGRGRAVMMTQASSGGGGAEMRSVYGGESERTPTRRRKASKESPR